MLTTKITIKEAQDLIKKEIDWCESPEAQAVTTSEQYKRGFVAGLNQSLLLLESFCEDEYAENIEAVAQSALRKERVKQIRKWERRTGKSMIDTIINMPTSEAEEEMESVRDTILRGVCPSCTARMEIELTNGVCPQCHTDWLSLMADQQHFTCYEPACDLQTDDRYAAFIGTYKDAEDAGWAWKWYYKWHYWFRDDVCPECAKSSQSHGHEQKPNEIEIYGDDEDDDCGTLEFIASHYPFSKK